MQNFSSASEDRSRCCICSRSVTELTFVHRNSSAEVLKREAEFCAWQSIGHIVASTVLHVRTCWSLLVHTLLFKVCIVPKAAVLAGAATSQASPPPPVLVKGDGQGERHACGCS